MFCTKCGKEVRDEAVVCTGCGCVLQNGGTVSGVPGTGKKTQTAAIFGIIGIVFAWIFALIGHITSIIGIVQGIKEYKESDNMTGLVLSIIGEVLSIMSSVIGAITFSGMF